MENLSQVDIQLTNKDKEIIKEHVSKIESPNCYLEIGVHQGGSALQALEVASDDVELYGVDILNNIRLKDTRFNFINKPSLEAVSNWEKSVGVLFIDADHNSAGYDFRAWEKFVVNGGIVMFHDYAAHSPNVIKHCEEILKEFDNYELIYRPIGREDLTSIFQIRKNEKI